MTAARNLQTRPALTREEYERYLPLVRRIAIRVARKVPRSISVNDLVAWGWVGFIEAYGRAEGMPEAELEAYASYRIRGAMLDFLRGLDPATRRARSASRKVAQAIARLSQRLGRTPEEPEIAAELGMTEEAYRDTLGEIADAGMARLEVLDVDMLDSLETKAILPDEQAGRVMMVESLAKAVDQLPPRLQQVMGLYYQEECTLREIGAILGVTESRVCQLHTEAIHRMRATLGME
jgi:RNA polymerase sigma factor for flagellar operon FliA